MEATDLNNVCKSYYNYGHLGVVLSNCFNLERCLLGREARPISKLQLVWKIDRTIICILPQCSPFLTSFVDSLLFSPFSFLLLFPVILKSFSLSLINPAFV